MSARRAATVASTSVRLCASASILAFTIAAEATSRAFLPAACFAASLAAPPAESAVDIAVRADSGKTQTMQVVTPKNESESIFAR